MIVLADQQITTMSVLVKNEVGWLVDHQQEINNTYAMTYIFENNSLYDYFGKRADFVSERQTDYSFCQFKAVPELFAIRHTYVMDSHFNKSTNISQTADSSNTVVERLDMANSDPQHELADHSVMSSVVRPALKSKVNYLPKT